MEGGEKMKNKNVLIVILAVVIGGGAFFAGMKYQQNRIGQTFGRFGNQQGDHMGQFQQGVQGFRPVNGEIISADDKSITVKLADGSSKIVLLTDTAVINKSEPASKTDLTVGEKGYVESGISGKYDLFGEIYNPNNDFGSGSFNYKFEIKDSSGIVLNQFSGRNFILPGEKKYLVATNVLSTSVPGEITLTISEVEWEEFINYEKPQLKIINRNYQETNSGVGFSEASGLLKNESPFDFSTIKVNMLLKNSAGKIVALNSTILNTVKTGESRDFKAIWPNKFPGEVGDMEFQTEVNVFSSESFARRYFRGQKFQEYE